MKKPMVVRLPNGNFLVNGTMEIEPPDPRPAPQPPTFGRMAGEDGEVVDVAIFENGLIVERSETPRGPREAEPARAQEMWWPPQELQGRVGL